MQQDFRDYTAVPCNRMTIKEAKELKELGIALHPSGEEQVVRLALEDLEDEDIDIV